MRSRLLRSLDGCPKTMFTGLIEETGAVHTLLRNGDTARLTVVTQIVHEDCRQGDSVAVNGCCLTVVQIDGNHLSFDVGDETLKRTDLGAAQPGTRVNLERALRASDRMGGHYVTGHVDALIRILQRDDAGEWSTVWFELPHRLAGQVAEKGSVAIDGISLTVVTVLPDRFSVMLVPHTLAVTSLGERKAGDSVNLETDLLAKYVQRQLSGAGKPQS